MTHSPGSWWAAVLVALATGSCASSPGTTREGESTDDATTVVTLPPAETDAAEALAGSPRRGEWVEIERAGGDPIATWIVRPQRSGSHPVVLVVHEIFGLTDWVRAVADRLAEAGYVAVVPDLLSGLGPGGGGTRSVVSRDEVVRLIRGLDPDEALARLGAVSDFATTVPGATGQVAVVGFSWGGSTGFAFALDRTNLEAAVVYYGSSPPDTAEYHRLETPVLGLYGEDDAEVNATIETATREMTRYGKRFEIEIFPGAGHGFLRAQDTRGSVNRSASAQAWQRTLDFLRTHLSL